MQDIVETLVDAVPTASRPLDHAELASRARTRIVGRRLAVASVLIVVAVGGVLGVLDRAGSAPDADIVATEVDGDVVDTETTEPAPLDPATLEDGFGTWTELATLDLGGLTQARRVKTLSDGRLLIAADSATGSGSGCQPEAACFEVTGIFDPGTGEWRDLPPLPEGFGPIDEFAGLEVSGTRLLVTTEVAGLTRYAAFDTDTWTWTVAPEPVGRPARWWTLWTGETVILAPVTPWEGREVEPEAVSLLTWTIGDAEWRTAASAPDEIQVSDVRPSLVGDDVHYVSGDRAATYDPVDDTWTSLPPLPAFPVRNGPTGTVGGLFAVPTRVPSESGGTGDPAYVTLEGDEWVTHPVPDEAVSHVMVRGNQVTAGVGNPGIGIERWWYDIGAGWESGGDVSQELTDGGALIRLTAAYQYRIETDGVSLSADLEARLAEAQTLSYRTGVETWAASAPAPFTGKETLGLGSVGDRVVLLVGGDGTRTTFWLFDPAG